VQPSDILEKIWTHEAVEKHWEALRQRRFKTALIAASRQEALAAILHPLLSDPLDVDQRNLYKDIASSAANPWID
jgi:hypothetical protein